MRRLIHPYPLVIHNSPLETPTQNVIPIKQAGFNLQVLPSVEFAPFIAEQDRVNGDLLKRAGLAR